MPDRTEPEWWLVQEKVDSAWSSFAGPYGPDDRETAERMMTQGAECIGGSFRLIRAEVVEERTMPKKIPEPTLPD